MAPGTGPRRQRGRPRIDEITEAQQRTLTAIAEYQERHGTSPTLAELCEILDLGSTAVHDSVSQLIRKGYLARKRYSRRGLKILKQTPSRISRGLVNVRLLGRVAAGVPTFAEENYVGDVLVPARYVDGRHCFALRVQGDSMKGADMHDGDIVIVRRQPLAESGAVVVALVNGEPTIKRLHLDGQTIQLRPENKKYKPIPIEADTELQILGLVVSHSRQWS